MATCYELTIEKRLTKDIFKVLIVSSEPNYLAFFVIKQNKRFRYYIYHTILKFKILKTFYESADYLLQPIYLSSGFYLIKKYKA